MRKLKVAAGLCLAVLMLGACGTPGESASSGAVVSSSALISGAVPSSAVQQDETSLPDSSQVEDAVFTLTSGGVQDGVLGDAYGAKGDQFTGQAPSFSPPLVFSSAPEGTVCYALVMNDPDAEPIAGYVWDHWLAANITVDELPENASVQQPGLMVQGTNSFDTIGYGGPTPPEGTHTYVFTAYALDTELSLEQGFSLRELENGMDGHVLATATLEATYSK